MPTLTSRNTDVKYAFLAQCPLLGLIIGVLLFASNVYLYLQSQQLRLVLGDTGFTGVGAHGKSWTQFHTYTEFSDLDAEISDTAWSRFTTNGFVAIPHGKAAESGLPIAQDFPDDNEKGIYVISAFHQLHCVVIASCSDHRRKFSDG